jgi:hypothetical protein
VTVKLSSAWVIVPAMDIRLASPALDFHVDVRLTQRHGRWVAVALISGEREVGVGRTAPQALAASIATLGRDAAILLADPSLMAHGALTAGANG